MRNKTALFIGHSDIYALSSDNVKSQIESLIKKGVCRFLSGGMGNFDIICASCVKELKSRYPHIENLLVIPYLSFKPHDISIYDGNIYPEGLEQYHFKAAIPKRNKYMVDNSCCALCYIDHLWGGAAQTYKYAVKKNLEIINLGNLQ